MQKAKTEKEQLSSEARLESGLKKEKSDEESISNHSFNYFFYLIYKVKFEDIFQLPSRGTSDTGISIHRVNVSAIIERLL